MHSNPGRERQQGEQVRCSLRAAVGDTPSYGTDSLSTRHLGLHGLCDACRGQCPGPVKEAADLTVEGHGKRTKHSKPHRIKLLWVSRSTWRTDRVSCECVSVWVRVCREINGCSWRSSNNRVRHAEEEVIATGLIFTDSLHCSTTSEERKKKRTHVAQSNLLVTWISK